MSLCCIGTSLVSNAEPINFYINQKQEAKEKSRWTLTEWLDTRDRMRLMDMWLALHSPSPYEFFFGGQTDFLSQNNVSVFGYGFQAAAYATIFGLEGHYDSLSGGHRWLGIFDLRFFGYHAQGTNMTLQVGINRGATSTSFQNILAGLSLTMYFAKHFGIQGLFRHYFGSGKRWEAGAFIDFSFIRVYGSYLTEQLSPSLYRQGISAGTQIYF